MRTFLLLCLAACTPGSATLEDTDPHGQEDLEPARPDDAPPNVLLVLLDDIGVDKTSAYDDHPTPPITPSMEALADQGVRFTQAWAEPSCSVTRAALLTGRHPFRTGIGRWIDSGQSSARLPDDVPTLPEVLAQAPVPYTSVVVGKWHLTGFQADAPAMDPLRRGFAHHRGSLGNPKDVLGPRPQAQVGYRHWQKSVDGELAMSTAYMTTDTVDDALTFVRDLPEPWLVYVPLNAAHTPWHLPPPPLPGSEAQPTDVPELFDAMVRATDAELGRLLEGIDLTTTLVVVLGDNGTDRGVITPPWDTTRGKATLWESGLRVPFLVAGPGVPAGAVSDLPVSVVDLLPTLTELAGIDLSVLRDPPGSPVVFDGRSLLGTFRDPGRGDDAIVFAQTFFPNRAPPWTDHRWALREGAYKLFEEPMGTLRFARIEPGTLDEVPIAPDASEEADAAYARLDAERLRLFDELLDHYGVEAP